MKKIYLIFILALISMCCIFMSSCGNVKVADNSESSNIIVSDSESDSDMKITINITKNELTYAEIEGSPTCGMQVYGAKGERLKVNLLSDIYDATGKIVYGSKTLKYEAVDVDGKHIVFTRDIVVTETNRPTFKNQNCDFVEIIADYDEKDTFGIDLGYYELKNIVYDGTPLSKDDYTVYYDKKEAALSKKAAFINGSYLKKLGVGEHVFEVITDFGYNNYVLNVTDDEEARYMFDGDMDRNYILSSLDIDLPLIVPAENSYQSFDVDYGIYYKGQKVSQIDKTGEYVYSVNIHKEGFSDKKTDFPFYYMSEKSKEVFMDPVLSDQFKDNYSINKDGRGTISFNDDEQKPYYLFRVQHAYSRLLNAFQIDSELLRQAIEKGLTKIFVEVKVAEESELSNVDVRFYAHGGRALWQSSKISINNSVWTTISVDLSTITKWDDTSVKGYTVDDQGHVSINFAYLSITTDYAGGENYSLMISNIYFGETSAQSGIWFTQDREDSVKVENGTLTITENGIVNAYQVSFYGNGLIKIYETDDFTNKMMGDELYISKDGETIEYHGKIFSIDKGTKDNPYMYDIY